MKNFKNKYGNWALITGASSGIGKCFAETLSQINFNLFLVARDENKLNQVSKELSEKYQIKCEIIVADLTNERSIDYIIQKTKDREVNLLINNAGYSLTGDFLADTVKSQTDLMKINSLIPMQLCQRFGQKMLVKGKGGIINVSSVSGVMPLPKWTIYSASKAFMKSFSESLWYELKPKGIDVLALCPGATKTNFYKTAKINSSGLSAKKVVNVALKNIGKRPSIIIGTGNKFLMAFISIFPLKLKIKLGAIAVEKMRSADGKINTAYNNV